MSVTAASRGRSAPARPSGRRAVISTLEGRSPNWLLLAASARKRSGWTMSGRLPRTCWGLSRGQPSVTRRSRNHRGMLFPAEAQRRRDKRREENQKTGRPAGARFTRWRWWGTEQAESAEENGREGLPVVARRASVAAVAAGAGLAAEGVDAFPGDDGHHDQARQPVRPPPPQKRIDRSPPNTIAERYMQNSDCRASARMALLPRLAADWRLARASRRIATTEAAVNAMPAMLSCGASRNHRVRVESKAM